MCSGLVLKRRAGPEVSSLGLLEVWLIQTEVAESSWKAKLFLYLTRWGIGASRTWLSHCWLRNP